LGLKLVSIRVNNPKNHGLPTIPAQVLLVDPETSQPMVLMDATYLTLLRTAAGSGVATRLMASPQIEKLVVFGAGNQAKVHIEVPKLLGYSRRRPC
jgi:ornithine cyclodeaminase/alanine dehydrogenase-like protein (mu-crystallin family)